MFASQAQFCPKFCEKLNVNDKQESCLWITGVSHPSQTATNGDVRIRLRFGSSILEIHWRHYDVFMTVLDVLLLGAPQTGKFLFYFQNHSKANFSSMPLLKLLSAGWALSFLCAAGSLTSQVGEACVSPQEGVRRCGWKATRASYHIHIPVRSEGRAMPCT